jgi:hypothetical protein
MRQLTKRLVQPLRLAAGWFALDPNSYVGADGCIRTGASFIAWNQVEGDYLEFGVFEGASYAAKPRFFAFDSFAGLPDGEADRHADYGAGAYACSQSQFHANIAAKGVDMARVVTVPAQALSFLVNMK